jgi:hypothetical protein
MKSKCNNCKRTSEQTEGWWRVIEHPTAGDYQLCPSCYRNKSLNAYRDTLLELIKEIKLSHSEPDIKMGMEMMRMRCEAIVRDTVFNV